MAEHPDARQTVNELETGIFNLVISMCQHLAVANDATVARAYVAEYLERLAAGLRTVDPNQKGQQNEH